MNSKRNLKFMCIGAQKSGTTWLYEQLNRHDSVRMPPLKEIHYFDEIERGINTFWLSRWFDRHWMNQRWRKIHLYFLIKLLKFNYRDAIWFAKYLYGNRGFTWYDKLFDSATDKVAGDITPDYLIIDRELVERIHQYYPNLKVILLMRNPIERKWSHIKMVLGEKRNRDFSQVSEQEYLHACENWVDDMGNYPKALEVWQSVFGNENVFTGYYDELQHNPVKLYNGILDFLGLPHTYNAALLNQVVYGGSNASMPRNAFEIIAKQKQKEIEALHTMLGDVPDSWIC